MVDQGVKECTVLMKAGVAEKWNGRGWYIDQRAKRVAAKNSKRAKEKKEE